MQRNSSSERSRLSSVCSAMALVMVLAGPGVDAQPVVDQPPDPPSANARGSGPLESVTLESAVRRAVEWHPSVQQVIGVLRASDANIDVAKAGYRPEIDVSGSSGYDNLTGSRWRPRAAISASQMIVDFGKVSSTVDYAKAGSRISEAQVLLAVDMLARDTSYAVIEIQRSVALRQVAAEQVETIRGISDLVDRRFQRGAATRSDALQAQARVQSAVATMQQIDAELQRWQSNLAHLLGQQVAPVVSSDIPPGLLDSCGRGEPDWDRIPAIIQAIGAKDQAQAELRLTRANGLPTVSLGAGASGDVNDPLSRRAEYNFGINVTSSLYQGGANRARTRGAAYSLDAAQAAEANVRNEVSRVLSESQRQVDSFVRVADTLQARQESMKETGMLYRLQYLEMGTRTLVDLLNAQQELHQVRFDLVNTRHDLRRLSVDCLYSSGAERDAFQLTGMVIDGVQL